MGDFDEANALRDSMAKAEYWQRAYEVQKRVSQTITAENAVLSLLLHEHGIKPIEPGHPYAALLKMSKEPTRAEELLRELTRFVSLWIESGDPGHPGQTITGLLTSASTYLRERGLL